MEVILRLFFPSIISCTHSEPLLGSLCGLKVHVSACSIKEMHCEGAVFLANWIVVNDSCIRKIERIYVQEGIANCIKESKAAAMEPMRDSSVRRIVSRSSHPYAPNVDLALLRLDWPFKEELNNRTVSSNAQNILNKWLKNIKYSTNKNINGKQFESNTERQFQMYSTPFKMLFVSVILPFASFIVFFLFIVFYTGTPDTHTSNIPYKTLNNDKKSSQV